VTSLNVIFDVLHDAVYHSELSLHINLVMFCIKLNTCLLKYDENTHVLASETLRRVLKMSQIMPLLKFFFVRSEPVKYTHSE